MSLAARIRAVVKRWEGASNYVFRAELEDAIKQEESLCPTRRVVGYVVLDPSVGRPCFWSHIDVKDASAARARGVEVFEFVLDLPAREQSPAVDGTVSAMGVRRL